MGGKSKWASKTLTDAQRLAKAAAATRAAAEQAAGKALPSLAPKAPRARRKIPKRRGGAAPGGGDEMGVFNTFVLNKDPDCSAYMPYNDVSYPRLQNEKREKQAFAELESLWMVGFLHHNKKTKSEEVAKDLQPFLRLPGSTVLPRVEKDLSKVIEKDLVNKRNDLSPRIYDPNDVRDPSEKDNRTKMSDEERMRLDQLGDQLVKNKQTVSGMRLYEAANYKIRRVIRDKKPRKHPPTLKSTLMEQMFEVERRETQGAIIIQHFWHKYLIIKQLKDNVNKGKRIVIIQAMIRGMITRKWLSLWYKNRFLMIIQWQARFRRHLSNKHYDEVKIEESAAAVKMQKGVRMFLGKCVAYWKRLHLAAERVQCLWRGCIARARSDKVWLDRQVTFIQSFTRFGLAKGKFKEEKAEMDEAASLISRCWRGFWGRKLKNDLLYARETACRQAQVRLLGSEEQFYADHIRLLERRIKRAGLDEKNNELTAVVNQMYKYVEDQEFNYVELMRQKECVSPRAIEQGWVEELGKNIRDHRNLITKFKLECLFDKGLEQRQVEEDFNKRMDNLNQVKMKMSLSAKWREEELEQIWARNQRLVYEMEDIWKRQAIAAERRKWGIKFTKASGKPDKLRRPGRPWDQSAFAGAEANTFCGGAANLFAYNNDHEKLRSGGNESIARIMEKLQLQSYLNQQQQYEALLKPLAENMQMAFTDGKDEVGISKGAMEDMTIPEVGQTPRMATPPEAKKAMATFETYENVEDDPYEDPYFKTDEEKKEMNADVTLNYKTPEERAAARRADNRRSKFRPPVSRLPWQLLDELQAEKDAFSSEKAMGKMLKMKEMREKEERKKMKAMEEEMD
jgi:hypothetical protein